MLKVQKRACSTCIYRKDSALDIKELERQVADPKFPDTSKGIASVITAGMSAAGGSGIATRISSRWGGSRSGWGLFNS